MMTMMMSWIHAQLQVFDDDDDDNDDDHDDKHSYGAWTNG